ncbi:MAG: MltA domain-containing protein [Rhizobiaceae bacterium]
MQCDAAILDRLIAQAPCSAPVAFEQISGWLDDDHAEALACFRNSARRLLVQTYSTKALGIGSEALAGIARKALDENGLAIGTRNEARAFFERHFLPVRIGEPDSGFVTGYFEPELEASPVRTPRFTYPLYGRPSDLVDIDDQSRPSYLDPSMNFARRTSTGLEPYPDRSAIEAGFLAGKGHEIVWLENEIEGFFVHVQGSARLAMPDGGVKRVNYAAKNGHPYTAIGKFLVETGAIELQDMTMQRLRAWLDKDPARAGDLIRRNRSFIFFSMAHETDSGLGPVGAASIPLMAGRSLAIDRTLHTFSTPVWVSVQDRLDDTGEKPWRALMVAQDTGSAIIGPSRGDIFFGSGARAGQLAGKIRHKADFIALIPRNLHGSA